ncbi:hypothetical protein E4U42_000623 [Claviceps africana]|uniref:Zn(2)-C6 fungal-type domain-containing protein n=1 Tax=Claviceps africana TaxID=83212 RepID=A0A8K0J0I6_9HYPO|nr:hypothetical protein E4U42_000623 [Claviceps africana]
MPAARSMTESKRRVRTGCLACRQRRRKCDERKPSCTSCQTRRVQCAYPDLLFIPRMGIEVPASQRSYTRIRFVHERERPEPISRATQSRSSDSSSPAARATPLLPTPASITIDSLLTTTLVHEPERQPPGRSGEDQPLLHWDGYFDTSGVSEGRRHAALLRHFRYKMAPWMEAGDPRGLFGAGCMFLAQEHPSFESAMLGIAAEQIHVLRRHGTPESLCRHSGERGSPRQRRGEFVLDVADSLYATARYFCAGAEIWRQVSGEQVAMLRSASCPSAMPEPLQTLVRLHSRFDLASSVILRRAPCTPAWFFAPNRHAAFSSSSSSPSSSAPTPPPTTTWDDTGSPSNMYNWSLHHLALCLYLVHDPSPRQHDEPASQHQPPPLLVLPDESLRMNPPHAKWLALWRSCQAWRVRRPPSMRPIVDIGTMEASQMQQDGASFPIQLYTSALAVQANIFYHLTSLLLLSHKPRLLNKLAGPHGKLEAVYTSQGWHAQHIAGVASTNEFAEQWDPIVFAALLLVGKGMTHKTQQRALRTCLRAGSAVTGLMAEDGGEMGSLEDSWRAAEGSYG